MRNESPESKIDAILYQSFLQKNHDFTNNRPANIFYNILNFINYVNFITTLVTTFFLKSLPSDLLIVGTYITPSGAIYRTFTLLITTLLIRPIANLIYTYSTMKEGFQLFNLFGKFAVKDNRYKVEIKFDNEFLATLEPLIMQTTKILNTTSIKLINLVASDLMLTSFSSTIFTVRIVEVLNIMGHYYAQNNEPLKSYAKLKQAKNLLEGLINTNSLSDPNSVRYKFKLDRGNLMCRVGNEWVTLYAQSKEVSSISELLYNKIKQQLNEGVLTEVQLSEEDKKELLNFTSARGLNKSFYSELRNKSRSIKLNYANKDLQNQDSRAQVVHALYLPELYTSVLYSLGRIYFYNEHNKEEFYGYLQVAKEISIAIRNYQRITLLHYHSIDRNGLKYFDINSSNEKTIEEARNYYQELSEEVGGIKCYELGKEIILNSDSYHKLVCFGQILRANIKLMEKSATPHIYNVQNARLKDQILDLMAKTEMQNKRLSNAPSYYNVIGELYIAKRDYYTAIRYFEFALQISQNSLSYFSADSHYYLAQTYYHPSIHATFNSNVAQTNLLKANDHIKEAVEIRRKIYPASDRRLIEAEDFSNKLNKELTKRFTREILQPKSGQLQVARSF